MKELQLHRFVAFPEAKVAYFYTDTLAHIISNPPHPPTPGDAVVHSRDRVFILHVLILNKEHL